MKDLTVRLDALDPQAGAALRVIAYFDDLVAHGAGLQAIVRAAAVLTAGPAALVDDARRVRIRVDGDGHAGKPSDAPDPAWPSVRLGSGDAVLWLEYSGPTRPVDAMVLERAAAAAAAVLDRTRGRRANPPQGPASVETLLDPATGPEARATAARRLKLPESGQLRAVALHGGDALVHGDPDGAADALPEGARAGIGPAVPVEDLPASWTAARLALRLTAEGTPGDPGPRVVHADTAGGLMLLAQTVGPDTPRIQDVVALERAAQAAPWMLAALDALANATSLRAAATALRVHHSTLQERAAHAERLLGWPVNDAPGRLRLHLALVLRRLHRAPI
ncbi:PucR family transcriptional regulator [Actinomadura craniellae]|uniref:PucR family transcriptional regulator n=1 Tax=Actinomadura craniellae TaxID=2231787 RepID=A0A365H516_9ACTN|nr:helix-turn-helix domain-containing protein [Actinomadura craniellae]RAY14092.1 PucR family transcriptional regulator [Actinomadura craniellae]